MSIVHTIAALCTRERVLIAAARSGGSDMTDTADKVQALLDVSRALAAAGIAHAVVGGVAVGIRSQVPRATLDTDLAVPSTTARPLLLETLTAAGFALRGEFAHSVKFRYRSGEPEQIVADAAFDVMVAHAETVLVGDTAIPVVVTVDPIAMKERAGVDPARRPSKALRDRADVALLRGDVGDPDEGW